MVDEANGYGGQTWQVEVLKAQKEAHLQASSYHQQATSYTPPSLTLCIDFQQWLPAVILWTSKPAHFLLDTKQTCL